MHKKKSLNTMLFKHKIKIFNSLSNRKGHTVYAQIKYFLDKSLHHTGNMKFGYLFTNQYLMIKIRFQTAIQTIKKIILKNKSHWEVSTIINENNKYLIIIAKNLNHT